MSKVFRLHTGNNTITDWQTSEKYGANVINQIKDPDGATATKEITSIPSPFARMDLVKTAFRYLTESRQIDGTTIYHKMVSDTLDVGEIFFNIDSLSDKIQILFWDTDNLQEMRSSSEGHRSLAATLEMYLGEDATAYNFDRMKRICLLNYIGADRPAPMNIIGATSPATLFFCSANRLAYVSNHILFGQHKTFSDEFTPLYARDFAYQKFLYAFVKYYGKDFATHFPEVYDYLEQNYQFLPDERKTEISALTEESIHEFEELTVGSNSVEVLGCRLRKRPKTNRIKSEFEIASTLYVAHESDKRPLVLPVEAGNSYTSLRYVSSRWDKHFKAPYADAAAWESRSLPYANEKYPYLTISDFLEDTIIRLPASFSSDSFFEGNKEEGMAESYLLPLTDLFFSFFSVADLMRPLVGGKPMLELRKNAGGVKVILRIPINEARDFVEYARIFFENRTAVLENNTGKLIEESARDFGFALFPSIRYADARDASYRFGLTTPFAAREHYTADYYAAGKKLISQAVVRNGQYKQAPAAT
ncbi:MAG: hypothetical protein LBM61_02035, partial [Prevotellaceae bacterium]|nr:hypothetical protein [Prevotellaceae bacterium]